MVSSQPFRYFGYRGISTPLNPLDDATTWLGFLTATDYVEELLRDYHQLKRSDARRRARRVVPNVRYAVSFVEQARSSSIEVSFLPAYYAILNLLKAMVLFGQHHHQLQRRSQRHHGVTYRGRRAGSSFLADTVELKSRGTLPLAYLTITGETLPQRPIKLESVYSKIAVVGAEYELAARKVPRLAVASFGTGPGRRLRSRCSILGPHPPRSITQVRLLDKNVWKKSGGHFVGPELPSGAADSRNVIYRSIRPYLLTTPQVGSANNPVVMTPISAEHILWFEELPLALAFFHLSSVTRYNPESLDDLAASRFWPLISSLRTHGLLRFLTCFLSYTHQQAILIHP